jgi:hypothetical protein
MIDVPVASVVRKVRGEMFYLKKLNREGKGKTGVESWLCKDMIMDFSDRTFLKVHNFFILKDVEIWNFDIGLGI